MSAAMIPAGTVGGRPVHDYDCQPASFETLVGAGLAFEDEGRERVEAQVRAYVESRQNNPIARDVRLPVWELDESGNVTEKVIDRFRCGICAKTVDPKNETVAVVRLGS